MLILVYYACRYHWYQLLIKLMIIYIIYPLKLKTIRTPRIFSSFFIDLK